MAQPWYYISIWQRYLSVLWRLFIHVNCQWGTWRMLINRSSITTYNITQFSLYPPEHRIFSTCKTISWCLITVDHKRLGTTCASSPVAQNLCFWPLCEFMCWYCTLSKYLSGIKSWSLTCSSPKGDTEGVNQARQLEQTYHRPVPFNYFAGQEERNIASRIRALYGRASGINQENSITN